MKPSDFIETKLTQVLDKLAKEKNKKVYIAGDFNFNLLKCANHGDTADFYDKMTSNLLVPLILVPTKINSKNDTLIDNIFSNQFNSETISGNLTVNFSDGHLPSFAIFPKPNQNHLPKKHNLYTRDIKNMDKENFLMDLAALDMDAEIIENDGERSLDNLLTKINKLIDKYAPLRKITRSEFKQTRKPWITSGILTSIKNKDKLYHKYINTKNTHTRSIILAEYKALKNRINVLIFYSKKDHYSKYFNQYSNNIKKVWQGIKGIINIKTKDHNSPNCIEVNKELVTDNTEICNEYNKYFSTVADNILENNKTPILNNNTFDKYLKNRNSSSFVFEPCTPNEVFLLIGELNSSKSTGPNGIPTEILKMINFVISIPLSKIINICIRSGKHPEKLKLAHVIPIFKKGCRLLVSNYRPISLLSNINKIFEKIMHKRIYAFLDKFNLLYELQFGFRSKYSTSHALIHMTETIRSALDSGFVTCGIFVDFQKAFDTVNHQILLKKLDHYGFRGVVNDWFRSYLTDRKQKVVINGFESSSRSLPHGVPQGSVLGPILFLIYINDLHHSIKYCTTYHFADDTNLLNISKDYKTLERQVNYDLFNLHKWLVANKISLNQGKTELIYFRKSGPAPILNIKLHGKRLIPSTFVKYLGVYLDEYLNGEAHCREVVKKLNRGNGMLAKARHFVPFSDLKNIYHAIFASHLMYGAQVWTPKLLSVSDKISRLQKSAMRIMTFSEFKAHSEPLFKKVEILKFTDSISLQNCIFVFDYLHGNLPNSFTETFQRIDDTHTTETRQACTGILSTPRYNSTEYGLKCIYKKCINSWNDITSEINIIEKNKYVNKLKSPDIDLMKMSRNKLKETIQDHILSKYKD